MMHDSDEEIKAGIHDEWIVENLCLGDNVAVPNSTNEPLWLLLVDKGPHLVVISFMDEDGNAWIEGDVVVCG
jgi:hypothetical protein